MKTALCLSAFLCFMAGYAPVRAATITFEARGVQGVSGFVSIDDHDFDGTNWQYISNSRIVDLSLTAFGQVFTLQHVTTASGTFIDSSGALPRIVNGSGRLAGNGSAQIAFFPDGFDGTAQDGDASLAFSAGEPWTFHAVRWDPAGVEVPEPSSFALFGAGLTALAWMSLRRFQPYR
jgi:hypothetical protein